MIGQKAFSENITLEIGCQSESPSGIENQIAKITACRIYQCRFCRSLEFQKTFSSVKKFVS